MKHDLISRRLPTAVRREAYRASTTVTQTACLPYRRLPTWRKLDPALPLRLPADTPASRSWIVGSGLSGPDAAGFLVRKDAAVEEALVKVVVGVLFGGARKDHRGGNVKEDDGLEPAAGG